jgi:hypothetical protein
MQARRDSLTPVFCHTCIRKRTCHLHQDTVGTSISMRRRLSGCKWTPSTCITIVRVPCQSVLLLDTSTPCQRPPPGLSTLRITKGLPCPAWVICGACSCSPSPSYTAHTRSWAVLATPPTSHARPRAGVAGLGAAAASGLAIWSFFKPVASATEGRASFVLLPG